MIVGERPVVDDADTGEHRERAPHLPLAQRFRKNQNEHCGGEDHRTDEPRPHRTQEQRDRGEAQRGVEVRVVGGRPGLAFLDAGRHIRRAGCDGLRQS